MIQTVLALTIVAGAAAWLVRGFVRKALGAKRAACGACSTGGETGDGACPACPRGAEPERAGAARGLLQIADR
jgi:hypothetical protein